MVEIEHTASVSTALAHRMIADAETRAAELGVSMTVAICDKSGVLKAFSGMDGTPTISVQVAQDKAFTAVGVRLATDAWYELIKSDPPLAAGAVGGIDRHIIFGGGYPIEIDGSVVGGIGVSGGHYTQDMDVARAGLSEASDVEGAPVD